MDLFNEAVDRLEARKNQYRNDRRPAKPARNRLRWIKIEDQPIELTIRSPLEWWYSHWDVAARRTRRCCGPGCIPCTLGSPTGIRFVLAVEGAGALLQLLELRERHQEFLETLSDAPTGQIGARIRVFRAWSAKNAPIEIELIGRGETIPIEISRVTATLGLPAQRSANLRDI